MDFSEYIAKYLIPILERKKIVLVFLMIGIFLSGPINLIIKPEYITRATVFVEEPYYQSRKIWEHTPGPKLPSRGYIQMEAQRIQSPSFIIKVVKSLPEDVKEKLMAPYTIREQVISFLKEKLSKFRKHVIEKKEEITDISLVYKIMDRVSVYADTPNSLIYITAKTLRPEVGPVLLKTYLNIWYAMNLEENKESAKAQTEFAKKLRDKAYSEYIKAQEELTNFRKKYEIPGGVEVTRDLELMLQLNRLEAKVETAKERLKEMDELYTAAKMAEAGIVSNIKVVQYPEFPIQKTRIKSIKLAVATIFVFFTMGIVVALALEFIENPIRTREDIEQTVDIPVIGQIERVE